MPDPVVIQCAVTGSQPPDPERRPNLPITPDEIADAAVAAWRAGAAVIHLHAREDDGTPTQDRDAYADLVEGVRERGCEAILNLSTGTAGGRSERDDRFALLDLEPEMASFDCGTVNFGDRIFEGDVPFLRRMGEAFRNPAPSPSSSASTPATSASRSSCARRGCSRTRCASSTSSASRAAACRRRSARSSTCARSRRATPVVRGPPGRHQLMLNTYCLIAGGHVRTGLEDNLHYAKGELASNASSSSGSCAWPASSAAPWPRSSRRGRSSRWRRLPRVHHPIRRGARPVRARSSRSCSRPSSGCWPAARRSPGSACSASPRRRGSPVRRSTSTSRTRTRCSCAWRSRPRAGSSPRPSAGCARRIPRGCPRSSARRARCSPSTGATRPHSGRWPRSPPTTRRSPSSRGPRSTTSPGSCASASSVARPAARSPAELDPEVTSQFVAWGTERIVAVHIAVDDGSGDDAGRRDRPRPVDDLAPSRREVESAGHTVRSRGVDPMSAPKRSSSTRSAPRAARASATARCTRPSPSTSSSA